MEISIFGGRRTIEIPLSIQSAAHAAGQSCQSASQAIWPAFRLFYTTRSRRLTQSAAWTGNEEEDIKRRIARPANTFA
jgi:hypothetical protein